MSCNVELASRRCIHFPPKPDLGIDTNYPQGGLCPFVYKASTLPVLRDAFILLHQLHIHSFTSFTFLAQETPAVYLHSLPSIPIQINPSIKMKYFATATLFSLLGASGVLATPAGETSPNNMNVISKRAAFPIPASKGAVKLGAAKAVSGTFDGGMKTYDRGVSCTGQKEGGDADAVFILENGATLQNVIIGANQVEGVHCKGACTIKNVWWTDVCEGNNPPQTPLLRYHRLADIPLSQMLSASRVTATLTSSVAEPEAPTTKSSNTTVSAQ